MSEATDGNRIIAIMSMDHSNVGAIEAPGEVNYFLYCTYVAPADCQSRRARAGKIEADRIGTRRD